MSEPIRVLFVCLGNICRSPTAEGVFREMTVRESVADRFDIDSAGTGGWHVGEKADKRMRRASRERGYTLGSRARKVEPEDFERFDHIFAMDHDNLNELLELCPPHLKHKVSLFRDHDPEGKGLAVPDPYYGGPDGFEEVIDIVERTTKTLLQDLLGGSR